MVAALLIDLDGVLYVGERPLPGAVEAVRWLQAQGIPHRFLTNTTSRPRTALVARLARLGIDTDADHILTPPVAACHWLRETGRRRLALFVPEATRAEFAAFKVLPETAETGADAVVVGDLGEGWDFPTLNRAFRLLMAQEHCALLALGMTRYWQAPDGLRLDTGPFVEALRYASGREPVVTGKPAPAFFQAACEDLGLAPAQVAMLGDDVVTDVGAAQAAGLKGVLVETGKFRPADLERGIVPDARLPTLGDLPHRWEALAAL